MTIRSSSELEERVLKYHPELREQVNERPEAKRTLERIAGEEYSRYSPFIGGTASTASKVGHGLGYLGDAIFFGSAIAAAFNPLLAPYMLTGLLLKKANLVAQIPETVKTARYMAQTGDVGSGALNIGAKVASYLPGGTIVDRGLSRYAEKKAVSRVAYRFNEELGEERKSWDHRVYESLKDEGKYTDVQDRSENIIRPNFNQDGIEESEGKIERRKAA